MQAQSFLIKYAEIGVKGKNRYLFEDALVRQIKRALAPVEGEFRAHKESGRIYVDAQKNYEEEEVISTLQRVFGIVGICPMVQTEDEGWESLCAHVIQHIRDRYDTQDFTFKVEARRARKNYPKNSMELNADLGEVLLKEFPGLTVDVHHPEVVVHVEIRSQINIYSQILPGPGGMPVGTAGKAMLLLSGGIDSPVAGWMVAKRGVTIEAVYFHAPPYTSDRAKEKVVDLAKEIARYAGPIRLHVVNFTDIQLYIYDQCPHDELTIIMRRYMMRIAQHFALESGCHGLVTGESIGQVASQTMKSLMATDEVCEIPVYRPVIAFDKQEIIDIAQKIGTFETSILPYEDCCTIFVAKHPVTKPNLNIIRRDEGNLEEKIQELLEKAYETTEVIQVD